MHEKRPAKKKEKSELKLELKRLIERREKRKRGAALRRRLEAQINHLKSQLGQKLATA
jgi:hypothetical protein